MAKKRIVYTHIAPIATRKIGGRTYYLQDHFSSKADAERYADGFRRQGRLARIIKLHGNYEVFTTMTHGEFSKGGKR